MLGLAPGLSGANRTGRPFTGDGSGRLLYETLARFGFANGRFGGDAADGLELRDCMVTNAVRCAPPQNRPTPAEIAACGTYLETRLAALPRLRVAVCLGRVAHASLLRALGTRAAAHPFAHGARHAVAGLGAFDSYHCSRYNTNTGRLTEATGSRMNKNIVASPDAGPWLATSTSTCSASPGRSSFAPTRSPFATKRL